MHEKENLSVKGVTLIPRRIAEVVAEDSKKTTAKRAMRAGASLLGKNAIFSVQLLFI